jgi:hypothetical protein
VHDIVTGETCYVPASQNINNLGDAAVLLFPVCGWGCAYLSLQIKAIKLHLTLLMSSSHRLFIICSPQLLLSILVGAYQRHSNLILANLK